MSENTTDIGIHMDIELVEVSLNIPNEQTIAAILDAERIAKDPTAKCYTDTDDLFNELRHSP